MLSRILEREGLSNVKADCFSGLLVTYAKRIGATHIIRGLRATTDFEYEFQIDAVNRHLSPELRTLYFMAKPEHSFLSSSSIREIGAYGGNIAGLVPAYLVSYIEERLKTHE